MTRLRRYEKPDRPDIIPPRYVRKVGAVLILVGAPLAWIGEESHLWEYGVSLVGIVACMFGVAFLLADTKEDDTNELKSRNGGDR